MRTAGAFYADSPHVGGWLYYDALNLSGTFSANLVLTRNALGDYSLNRIAAGAETYQLVLGFADLKRLVEVADPPRPFQEQFGTAAGAAGYPVAAPGMPPFTGATQLTPPTTAPSKGIKVTDVVVAYRVGVVDLTAASLSLNRTVFANNVAPAVTNIPVDATALSLTAAGDPNGPYVVTRSVTTPAFETTDLSDLSLEFAVTMANTGTIRLYGLGVHVTFNYN